MMARQKHMTGYNEDFLNWWYGGGYLASLMGDDIRKANADYEWDSPTSPYATYQEPIFAAKVELWLARASQVYSLLPKTTFLAEGDSSKYVESELNGLVRVTATSTPFASLAVESAPTIVNIEQIKPGYYADPWKINWMSRVESGWQKAMQPNLDPQFVKTFHAQALPNQIDKLLTLDVDNAFGAGVVGSLDLLTIYDEASTTYCSAATDPDIYLGKSSVVQTRASDTDDTFGCGAGNSATATVLGSGTSTGARVLKIDYIDDVLADSIKFSKNKRYIMITGHKTINEMQSLIDPKQRYLNVPMDYQQTLNGVATRKGVEAGFTVGGLITNGLTVPVFGCDHLAGEDPANISATVTSQNIGNIYLIDLDEIELRIAVPVTYLESPPAAMTDIDYFQSRHMFIWAGQLVPHNWRAHAVVKYLKSS